MSIRTQLKITCSCFYFMYYNFIIIMHTEYWYFNEYVCTGLNPYLLEAWQGHRLQRPMVQLVNLGWTIGAAICPMVIQPFLIPLHHVLAGLAVTTAIPNGDTVSASVDRIQFDSNATDVFNTTEFEILSNILEYSYSADAGIEQKLVEEGIPDVSMVRYAYVLLSPLHLVAAGLFVISALLCTSSNKSTAKLANNTPQAESNKTKQNVARPIQVIFLFLSVLLLFSFACSDSIMLSMIVPIAIKSWGWSVGKAGLIPTVILSGSLVGRIVTVFTSTWLKPKIILSINITLFSVGCMMMLISQYVSISDLFMWTSFAVSGLGSSSFGPTFMLYLNQHIALTPGITSLVLISTSAAWLVCPYSSALLLERVGHLAVFQLILFFVIVSIVSFVALSCVSKKLLTAKKIVISDLDVDEVLIKKEKARPIYLAAPSNDNKESHRLTDQDKS